MSASIQVRKADGSLELFKPEKLRNSLVHSGATPRTIDEVMHAISGSLHDGISTDMIYREAMTHLRSEKPSVVSRYSLKRAVFDLGPTGFPFEDFVSELLKGMGYETIVRQTIRGKCVEHEIDLIAYKEGRRIGAELKFHNAPGLKTDLKVALYVHARFEDIEHAQAESGHTNTLDERWLVTNTKFTEQALRYAACVNLVAIGWSHPARGNLQDMVESSGLHPITCLSTITLNQKQQLLNKGHVMCRSLGEQPDVLREVGVNEKHLSSVLGEIFDLCGS